jgi:hypothetical protein
MAPLDAAVDTASYYVKSKQEGFTLKNNLFLLAFCLLGCLQN